MDPLNTSAAVAGHGPTAAYHGLAMTDYAHRQAFEAMLFHALDTAHEALHSDNNPADNLDRLHLIAEELDDMFAMVSRQQGSIAQWWIDEQLNEIASLKSRIQAMCYTSQLVSPQGGSSFVSTSLTGGRPRVDIPPDLIIFLRNTLNWDISRIAEYFGINPRTLHRRINEYGIRDRITYATLTDTQLDRLVKQYVDRHPNAGWRMTWGYVHSTLLRPVQHLRIQESLRRVSPIAAALRWKATIRRRQYRVAGSMALWHNDGWHKLIRWKIVVHGFIDGHSRMIVGLRASNNNTAATVLSLFHQAVQKYGYPSRCRGDYGTENNRVRDEMIAVQGQNRGSYICGRSVHNQRIERLWRDVNLQVGMAWASVFRGLEREGYLNVDNRIHIAALHWVVLPALNRSLAQKVQAWNHHPLSSQSNRTPLDLFISDRVSGAAEDPNFEHVASFGIEDADTAVEDSPNHVEVCINLSAEEEVLLDQALMEHIDRDYLSDLSEPFAVNTIIRAITLATAVIPY